MEITELTADTIDAAATLLEQYPYKQMQRRAQGLDPDKLQPFYLRGIELGLGEQHPHWIAAEGDRPKAMAALRRNEWHSKIFGRSMGTITTWINTEAPEAGEALLDQVEGAAQEWKLDHLSVRIDGEDYSNLHLFERRGFALVDVSLKFSLPASAWEAIPRLANENAERTVREAQVEDVGWMMKLGAAGHTMNHFRNDPSLPEERTRELFGQWVRRCAETLAYRIYAICDEAGEGRGFVIYLRNRSFAKAVGRNPLILDTIVLDPAVQTGGWGTALLGESLAREREQGIGQGPDSGFDYCELRTSQHNHPALAFYEKLGFRICATDFIIHKSL